MLRSKHAKPNEVTYRVMFKALGLLLLDGAEKDRYARTLFGLCCDDGCLGEMAHGRMGDAVSARLLRDLTGGREYANLPREWRRNVNASNGMASLRGKLYYADFDARRCMRQLSAHKIPWDNGPYDVLQDMVLALGVRMYSIIPATHPLRYYLRLQI